MTDNGNFVIDAPFDCEKMADPYIASNFLSQSYPKVLNECLDNVADKNVNWRGRGRPLLPYGEGGIFRKRGRFPRGYLPEPGLIDDYRRMVR